MVGARGWGRGRGVCISWDRVAVWKMKGPGDGGWGGSYRCGKALKATEPDS